MHRRTDVSSDAILCQTARGCLHRPACSLGYSACRAIQGNGRRFCNPTLISTLPKLSALDVMVCMHILPFCADVGHAYRQESPSLTTLRTVGPCSGTASPRLSLLSAAISLNGLRQGPGFPGCSGFCGRGWFRRVGEHCSRGRCRRADSCGVLGRRQ